jgi:hypothetical protein
MRADGTRQARSSSVIPHAGEESRREGDARVPREPLNSVVAPDVRQIVTQPGLLQKAGAAKPSVTVRSMRVNVVANVKHVSSPDKKCDRLVRAIRPRHEPPCHPRRLGMRTRVEIQSRLGRSNHSGGSGVRGDRGITNSAHPNARTSAPGRTTDPTPCRSTCPADDSSSGRSLDAPTTRFTRPHRYRGCG